MRVSNGTNIPYFDEVSKYFCVEQSLVLSSRVGFSHTIVILHQIHYCEEHGLSSSIETLSSRNQSTSDYWSQFIRVPDVEDILGKSFWSQYIVLQLRINSNTTRMSLDCSERQNVSGWVRVQTILKPFLLSSSSGQNRYPIFNWPLQSTIEPFLLDFFYIIMKYHCSVSFEELFDHVVAMTSLLLIPRCTSDHNLQDCCPSTFIHVEEQRRVSALL